MEEKISLLDKLNTKIQELETFGWQVVSWMKHTNSSINSLISAADSHNEAIRGLQDRVSELERTLSKQG